MLQFILPVQLESTKIDAVDLSVRASNSLKRAGIMTLGDLFDNNERQVNIAKMRNMGEKTRIEVGTKIFKFIFEWLDDNQQVPYLKTMAKLNEFNLDEFATFIEKNFYVNKQIGNIDVQYPA